MAAAKAENHEHPMSPGNLVYGRKLGNGDVLKEDDVYASTSGGWARCPCPGLTLSGFKKNAPVMWVRPGDAFDADEVVV